MVGWSHPNFGNLLASCSHDRKVLIWKETAVGWEQTKEHVEHEGSVNAVAWAPHAIGRAVLACASADGDISILTQTKGTPFMLVDHYACWAKLTSVTFCVVPGTWFLNMTPLGNSAWSVRRKH
eukprot:m.857340 g.857340  ORF g.857340 m.857340 type:complete len:123 (+) comp23519_c0_seq34:196-564(+)